MDKCTGKNVEIPKKERLQHGILELQCLTYNFPDEKDKWMTNKQKMTELKDELENLTGIAGKEWEEVKVAIHEKLHLLKFVPHEMQLKNKKEIVELLSRPRARRAMLKYTPDEIKGDRDVLVSLMTERGGGIIQFASNELRNDPDMAKLAIENFDDDFQLSWLGDQLRDNKEIVLKMIQLNWEQIELASERLQENEKMKLAVEEAKKAQEERETRCKRRKTE